MTASDHSAARINAGARNAKLLLLGMDLARSMLVRRMKATQAPSVRTETRRLLVGAVPDARRLYRRAVAGSGGKADKANLDGLPRVLRWLIQSLIDSLGDIFGQTEAGRLTVNQWYNLFREKLAEYHLASFMAGNGSEVVPEKAWGALVDQVNVQLDYLNGFKAEVQSAAEFAAGWQARAESYAGSVKQPYWTGRTKVLPLPAMPAQGTQCQNNCGCSWDVKVIDEGKENYDAYWRRSKDDSCQTCLEREAQWSPVQIRDGILQ